MKNLFAIALLLLAISVAPAAVQWTLTLTLTNQVDGAATNGTDAITIGGVKRTFTNNVTAAPGTLILGTNNQLRAFTNLYYQFALYPWAGPLTLRTNGTNSLKLTAPIDSPIAFSVDGVWGTCSTAAQTVATIETTVTVPITAKSAMSRTNIASGLVEALQYASNQLAAWPALDGFTRKTNGYSTNAALQSPHFTNAVNHANAFSSPGTNGTGSEQFGSGAIATADYSLAVGFGARATNNYGTALGPQAVSSAGESVAVGYAATASGSASISIGTGSIADKPNSLAIGSGAEATHTNSMAIGTSVTTSRTNELRLGGLQDVVIGGLLSIQGQLTNNDARITGGSLTNVSIAASSLLATSLVAHAAKLTNAQVEASSILATSLVAHAALLTNATVESPSITATALVAHAAYLTNVAIHIRTGIATNLQTLGGYSTNTVADRTFNTNSTFAGVCVYGGAVTWPRYDLSTLANGNNLAVPLGSNCFVRLSGTLTGTATLCGLVGAGASGGADGQFVTLLNNTGYDVILSSGTSDPVPANRIVTPSGSDITVSNLYSARLLYDSNAARWKLLRENL